jgi:hypothetical protein
MSDLFLCIISANTYSITTWYIPGTTLNYRIRCVNFNAQESPSCEMCMLRSNSVWNFIRLNPLVFGYYYHKEISILFRTVAMILSSILRN